MSVSKRRTINIRSLVGTGFGLFAALAATDAAAQSSSGSATSSEEIVVTATRREQALQDVPLAVNAISGEALQEQGLSSLQDLTKIDATFGAQNYGAAFNQFIIRGVASDIGSTVGMYLDEAPVIGGSLTESGGDGKPGIRLHDVQRVEILRGPQGTLFGSGSMSGTLRVITNRPDFESFSGDVTGSTQVVDDGNMLSMADATVNIPISDRFAIRAVGWTEQGGGYIDQVTPGFSYDDVNDADVLGGRLSASLRVTDKLTVTAMTLHQEINVDGAQEWYLDAGPYFNSAATVEPYRDQYDLNYLEATYDLGMGTLLAAFSSTDQTVYRPNDTTPTANSFGVPGVSGLTDHQWYDATTGEVRFTSNFDGPFQLVTGAYYQDSLVSNEITVILGDPSTGLIPCDRYDQCTRDSLSPDIVFSTLDNIDVQQYAIYAQGDYQFTPQVTGTLGIRYYSADIRDYGTINQDVFAEDPICSTYYVYRGFGPPNLCGFAFGDITVPYSRGSTTSSESKTSYNASLLWEPSDTLSIYARAASGFRIGGVNNSSLLAGSGGITIPSTFGPDSLWSYELGAKSYFWDHRGYVDVAVYRIDWSDQQINATDSSGAFDFEINAGKTQITGVELQGSITPSEGLTFTGGIVWTDANLAEDLPPNTVPGNDGDQLPRIADWAASGSVSYEWPLTSSLQGYTRLNGSYRGSSTTAFNNTDSNYLELDPYTLWDAALGVRTERWDARLFVQNISNEAAQLAINTSPDGARVYSPRPRSIGVSLSANF